MASGDSSFHFSCRRSGRCCRVPDGVAFVDEQELAALAEELAITREAFARAFVRSMVDPRSGEPRLALADRPDGACVLLDGDNECRAYGARPAACRDYPRWPSILGDPRGLERAMRTCPGIEQRPAGAARGRALAELQGLVERAARPGACRFPRAAAPEGPFLSGLELELLVEGAPELGSAGCPLETADGLCGAPERAPLACRGTAASSASGSSAPAADRERAALIEARDALEDSLPWPRLAGHLAELLRARRDPGATELLPTNQA